MEREELLWILVLAVCASSSINIVAENNERADMNFANIDYSGVISIDCGVNEGYTDKATNLQYQADEIQYGEIHNISSIYNFDHVSQIQKQLTTLRIFPHGKRNCYTLKPKQGKNKKHIIRAYFAYGNYDNKAKPPIFDLHLGVNFFKTINLTEDDTVIRIEAIHFASTDTIDFCLVNIGKGVPFISLLELWPLDNSIYQSSSTLLTLDLLTRINLGASEDNSSFIRYTDDIYGRSWEVQNSYYENSMKTLSAIDLENLVDPYKLPTDVLSTAVEEFKSKSLEFTQNYGTDSEYYVYLHFFDFKDIENEQKRILNIVICGYDDDNVTLPLILSYWKPNSIIVPINQGKGISKILIEATSDSDLPAMLNALEIYRVVPQSDSATQQQDVDAICHIKDFYNISRINWQGDPCEPENFTWEGVTCSGGDTPRIISLNLSSSQLSGGIDVSFSNLTYLEILDLSNNELIGEVPEFFEKLPQLKILNFSRNMLTGSIPESLRAKSSNNSLQLSLDENLCSNQAGSCKSNHQKFIIPLVASITTFVAVLIIFIIVMVIWRLRKNGKVISSISVKDEQLKSTNQVFSYSEIVRITNDFKTVIGKGGFGKVYLGTLESGKGVAVKVLSLPSAQGYKEFQSEAKLLLHIHHRNVVSLLGYCDEVDTKALIYEYLPEGNLQQKLSDKNPNIMEWIQRLKIAMDAANGLDYLHNGCKPPVIHRDLKTSNILLDENMHAKISDFGVSKTFANDTDTYITTYPAGTPGYVDPEFYCTGTLNKKSDVYSFGIILLELITGQPALRGTPDNLSYILPWVNNKLRTGDIQEIVDPRLQGKYNAASAWKFTGIAMSCLSQIPIHRPDIGHIASQLKECLSLELSLERTVSDVRDSLVMSSRQIEFH